MSAPQADNLNYIKAIVGASLTEFEAVVVM